MNLLTVIAAVIAWEGVKALLRKIDVASLLDDSLEHLKERKKHTR